MYTICLDLDQFLGVVGRNIKSIIQASKTELSHIFFGNRVWQLCKCLFEDALVLVAKVKLVRVLLIEEHGVVSSSVDLDTRHDGRRLLHIFKEVNIQRERAHHKVPIIHDLRVEILRVNRLLQFELVKWLHFELLN